MAVLLVRLAAGGRAQVASSGCAPDCKQPRSDVRAVAVSIFCSVSLGTERIASAAGCDARGRT